MKETGQPSHVSRALRRAPAETGDATETNTRMNRIWDVFTKRVPFESLLHNYIRKILEQ